MSTLSSQIQLRTFPVGNLTCFSWGNPAVADWCCPPSQSPTSVDFLVTLPTESCQDKVSLITLPTESCQDKISLVTLPTVLSGQGYSSNTAYRVLSGHGYSSNTAYRVLSGQGLSTATGSLTCINLWHFGPCVLCAFFIVVGSPPQWDWYREWDDFCQ